MTLSDHWGLQFPLIQAPMAGAQSSAMAIAVCQAGGLGSLPCALLSLEALQAELNAITTATDLPYNVNFFCHLPPPPHPSADAAWRARLQPYFDKWGVDGNAIPTGPGRAPFSHEAADVLEAFKPAVVSFHFGLPAPDLMARVKSWGSQVMASATTLEEAVWLQAQGVDAVIAQGWEAGGHRGIFLNHDLSTQMGTFALLPQLVKAVDVPVIAAGGIADATGVAAAMALGAAGVQVGTAYLLCPEATTSALHRAALASPAAGHTAVTNIFTGRPARGIVNRAIRELGPINAQVPAFPLPAPTMAALRTQAERAGKDDFTPLWAGQNVSGCKAVGAAEITRALALGFLPKF